MKKTILTLTALTIFTIVGFSQNLNKNTLCEKWYLEKYEVYWIDYEPEKHEKNDYIHLKNDLTYISVDEGEITTGRWNYFDKQKYIVFYNNKGESLKFFVSTLNSNSMAGRYDIEEIEDVKVHYKLKK